MQINTKYNIGDRVWVVYEPVNKNGYTGEVSVYDTYIDNINIDKDELLYSDDYYTELKEDDVILYEEKDKLINKIIEVMNKIHEREAEEEC